MENTKLFKEIRSIINNTVETEMVPYSGDEDGNNADYIVSPSSVSNATYEIMEMLLKTPENKILNNHVIHITVEEFLENGGVIQPERVLFNRDKKVLGYYKGYDEITKSHTAMNASTSEFVISTSIVFIKIDVVPIYN